MADFVVRLDCRARRDLQKLEPSAQAAIKEGLLSLQGNPFPHGKRIKKMKGFQRAIYRLRIDSAEGSFRVLYWFAGSDIIVMRIVPRKNLDRAARALK